MTSRQSDPWSRLQIDAASGVPIWVQLKTQLEYVIATGAVATNTRLPSVRTLSKQYGIAVDTVRQAYEELGKTGLVHTQHGVGTFTTLPEDHGSDVTSPDMSWTRADAALGELIRTGADPREAARAMAQRLALLHHGVDVVFVGVEASAERYAHLISAQLPEDFDPIRPVPIERLRAGELSSVTDATYALSLVFHAREIEELLSDRPVRMLSIMSRLEDGLLDAIGQGPAQPRPVLVARPETRPIYAELLRNQRPDLDSLPFVNDGDEPVKLVVSLAPSIGDEGYELVEVHTQTPWRDARANR
jgi:DNA-binding transcriptional regulator YhcF (GntR family)